MPLSKHTADPSAEVSPVSELSCGWVHGCAHGFGGGVVVSWLPLWLGDGVEGFGLFTFIHPFGIHRK